jgi:hypothetical protein
MITVVTALTDGKDNLSDDHVKGKAEFIAFTDVVYPTKLWSQAYCYDKFTSPRRNSRIHKILIHQYTDSEYSIWLDANLTLKVSPEQLIREFMQDCDIAVFQHPERDCIYDEAMICAVHKLDDQETIITQAKKYEDSGHPKHLGLAECNMIIRKNTAKVREFNNAWWSEYCRHSARDQISFMYVANRMGIDINLISPSARAGNKYFGFTNHLTARPE